MSVFIFGYLGLRNAKTLSEDSINRISSIFEAGGVKIAVGPSVSPDLLNTFGEIFITSGIPFFLFKNIGEDSSESLIANDFGANVDAKMKFVEMISKAIQATFQAINVERITICFTDGHGLIPSVETTISSFEKLLIRDFMESPYFPMQAYRIGSVT